MTRYEANTSQEADSDVNKDTSLQMDIDTGENIQEREDGENR